MPQINVREQTKIKLDEIAERTRRTLAETVDILCDEWSAANKPMPRPNPAKTSIKK